MRCVRNICVGLFVVLFAVSTPFAHQARAAVSECDCVLEETADNWGFFDCFSDPYCDASKIDCGLWLCGEDAVDWKETYCGNQNLLVTCTGHIIIGGK